MTAKIKNSVSYCEANIEVEEKRTLIDEREKAHEITYKLVRLDLSAGSMFIIISELGDEISGVCLGMSVSEARRIFAAVTDNLVTPCVLDEIIKDMCD